MKKLAVFASVIIFSFVLASCHYGQEDAQNTLKRNEEYKGDKADYSVNRAGEGSSSEEAAEAPAAPAADTTATK